MRSRLNFILLLACLAPMAMQVGAQPPRQLSQEDLAKLHTSVQSSKARNLADVQKAAAQARAQAERARVQAEEDRIAQQQREAEEAQADADWEAELADRRATSAAQKQAQERALEDSTRRLQATANRAMAMQAEARRRTEEDQRRAQAGAQAQRDADAARQATQRQADIARQLAAQREAADAARQQREDREAQGSGAAAVTSPRSAGCTKVHPKLRLVFDTVSGQAVGMAKVSERAAAQCRGLTGNAGYSGSPTCTANGPHILTCKIEGECAGLNSSTCSNSQ